jgi:hypothetical protein
MSTGRANLNVNGRGVDVNWFGDTDSSGRDLFAFRDWERSQNYINERFDISSISTSLAYGTTMSFELDKRGDTLGAIWLVCSRGAVTDSGTSPDLSFNDWEGYSCIDNITYTYGNKQFKISYGDELFIDMAKKWTRAQRDVEAQAQNGFKTLPQRVTLASATNTWCANLQVPWADLSKRIPMIALPNKIRVDVTLKPLSKCMRGSTAATLSCTISSLKLRCAYTHFPQAYRAQLFASVNSGKGVALKISTKEYQRLNVITSTQTTRQEFAMSNLKNAAFALHVKCNRKREVDGTSVANTDLWNFIPPTRFWLEDNGQQITNYIDSQDTAYAKFGDYQLQNRMYPTGIIGFKVPTMNFCEEQYVEPSDDGCFGSRNFSKYNNPRLIVQYDSGFDASLDGYCDIIACIHNLLIFQNGDLRIYLM